MKKMTSSVLDQLSADELASVIKRIVDLRCNYLHMTQSEFASALGITQGYISMLEQGKKALTYSAYEKILLTFNVKESWLLYGEDTKVFKQPRKDDPFLQWYDTLSRADKNRFFHALTEISALFRDYPPGSR